MRKVDNKLIQEEDSDTKYDKCETWSSGPEVLVKSMSHRAIGNIAIKIEGTHTKAAISDSDNNN
jgi:hypothetical protein